MNSKLRKYLTVITLGLAGGSIYFLPYVKYIFYDAQLATMRITNTQSGLMLTMYTVGNMIFYIPGGIIADKVSPKKALIISFSAHQHWHILYAFSMDFAVAMVIWLGLILQYRICILVRAHESSPHHRNRRRTRIHVRTLLCMQRNYRALTNTLALTFTKQQAKYGTAGFYEPY